MITAAIWIVGIAVGGYCLALSAGFLFQRAMMYPAPERTRTSPANFLPQAQEVTLKTTDGERIIAWYVPPVDDCPLVIFFHGNGEVLAWRGERFRALTRDGIGLLAVSFRGYGGSAGNPTEAGLLNDGEAAYAFSAARYPAERLAMWGYSLGTGVAVAVAAAHPVSKLILEAPYTSTVDVASAAFPFFPVRWLMRDTFASDQRIPDVTADLLILHGSRDTVIPAQLGRKLYNLAPGPKRFVEFPDATHIDLDEYGAVNVVREFLDSNPRQPM